MTQRPKARLLSRYEKEKEDARFWFWWGLGAKLVYNPNNFGLWYSQI